MVLDIFKSKILEYAKSKDTLRLSVLRYFLAAVKNREIELRPKGKVMDDAEALLVLQKQIKQRTESIAEFAKANRQDLVQKETAELGVLKEFLELFSVQ